MYHGLYAQHSSSFLLDRPKRPILTATGTTTTGEVVYLVPVRATHVNTTDIYRYIFLLPGTWYILLFVLVCGFWWVYN